MYQFQKAKAIWGENLRNPYNQFLGFYKKLNIGKEQTITVAITARSYYRLYINGEMIACGPARTARHHCRVDEIRTKAGGEVDIAVEVVMISKPGMYSNDCTLEPGILIAEIRDENDQVLTATGENGWKYRELTYRRPNVETMSHSRGIIEYYDLTPESFGWIRGNFEEFQVPVEVEENIHYLERRSPYPTYQSISMTTLHGMCDVVTTGENEVEEILGIARSFNKAWYDTIPEENCFLSDVRTEKEAPFSGSYTRITKGQKGICLNPGVRPASCTWGFGESELGFIEFQITVEKDCTLDVINSDHKHVTGILKANTYLTRYCLKPGSYHLMTFEPKLLRFVKMIFRTEGQVEVTNPVIRDYTFPDQKDYYFECNDGELNRIYEAARRTLRLNTLDIFMDCPQRERGGWLCDSHFTAKGAWQIFGDLSVEKDFIENFILTDPDYMWKSFFPDVYPGSKTDSSNPDIQNWSFWLMTELCEYYRRSGDREFIEQCRYRVTRFVEGVLSLRGESGLLENMNTQFVDWSISNRKYCLYPISIPNSSLAAFMLKELGELYNEPEWLKAAEEMSNILNELNEKPGNSGDAGIYENGVLRRGDIQTESGTALEIWSGFHRNSRPYMRKFIDTMGTCPRYNSNPNIGKSNIFIGLMIRFDALAQLDEISTLVKEWKHLYLPELNMGSGTLFENYAVFEGCHGFNGATGALITNKVLGLGEPHQSTKTVKINPHPGELQWASGSAFCGDGEIFLRWSADQVEHVLDMTLQLPENWEYELEIPFELSGWKILLNGEEI